MAFRQQLARRYVNTQQAFEAETQQMLQTWRAETKQQIIQECEAAADRRECSCWIDIGAPPNLQARFDSNNLTEEELRQPLEELLVELGFPEGTLTDCPSWEPAYQMEVKWGPEDATGSIPEPHTQTSGGTFTTCPICQEHRPAVVLVPCGHAICRDCHRCQQLRQCPMCRAAVTSATNGLFMD